MGRKEALGAPGLCVEETVTGAGLDPSVVKAAEVAGVPRAHLEEMARVVQQQQQGRSSGLTHFPAARGKPKPTKRPDPLSESEEEDEPAPKARQADPMTSAVTTLTKIAEELIKQQKRSESLEGLLDGAGSGGAELEAGVQGSNKEPRAERVEEELDLSVQGNRSSNERRLCSKIAAAWNQSRASVGKVWLSATLPQHNQVPLVARRDCRQPQRRPVRRSLRAGTAGFGGGGPAIDRP